MLIIGEFLFILLLAMILFMLYRDERAASRRLLPQATIEEYWGEKNRRQHMRFEKTLEVNYAVEKKSRKRSSGKTIDISEGGMKLLLDEKLAKGAIVNFKINIPGRNASADVEGEVVWSEDVPYKDMSAKRYFHSGIRFLSIKGTTSQELLGYIRKIGSEVEG